MRLALAALLALSCSTPVADRTPAPARGGTVVLAAQEPETLHPYRSTGTQTNAIAYRLAVEGLSAVAPDGSPRAVLASEIPTVASGDVRIDGAVMTVRWTLRPGLQWSDGEPVHDPLGRLVDVLLREALGQRCREIQIHVGEDGCPVWLVRRLKTMMP